MVGLYTFINGQINFRSNYIHILCKNIPWWAMLCDYVNTRIFHRETRIVVARPGWRKFLYLWTSIRGTHIFYLHNIHFTKVTEFMWVSFGMWWLQPEYVVELKRNYNWIYSKANLQTNFWLQIKWNVVVLPSSLLLCTLQRNALIMEKRFKCLNILTRPI